MNQNLSSFLNGKALFEEIYSIEPFPFIVDPAIMNLMLITYHGDRLVFNGVVDLDDGVLAGLIVAMFKSKWESYVKVDGLDPSATRVRNLIETVNTAEERTNSRNDLSKVSAYNSDIMMPDSGADSMGEDGLTGVVTRTLKDEEIDTNRAYYTLNNIARNSTIQKVLNDVSSALTLSIY